MCVISSCSNVTAKVGVSKLRACLTVFLLLIGDFKRDLHVPMHELEDLLEDDDF